MDSPLADLIRPKNLDEFIGQGHLVGKNKPLRIAIENRKLFSVIFWGPPGCGKTTLARILANSVNANFHNLSAVSAKKSDIKKIVDNTVKNRINSLTIEQSNNLTILFLDEIHRFNKAQQDFLLPYVENGVLTLIGATTENPSFEVISPLLSRCRVFVLNELTNEEVFQVINRALLKLSSNHPKNPKRPNSLSMPQDAKDWLVAMANGDARQAITMIENTYSLYKKLTVETLKETLQSKHLRYDKAGEEHYNTISAFIKSMRASDPDAAVYYLARMIDSGEDPLFIARRMVIFASEDIGIAQPTALVVANEVFRACETIGYPECSLNLAQSAIYLAKCAKNRSCCDALGAAIKDVKEYGNLSIPLSLRNAPTKLMKEQGYGKGYKKDTKESLLPERLKGKKYYHNQS